MAESTTRVRPFAPEDIDRVADLHRRVFRTGEGEAAPGREAYRAYFREVFLDNPWRDDALPSLVGEDADGTIVGFLGVVPRRMSLRGRPIQAALSSQFIVEPGGRSAVAAIELIKAFVAGPQDLSLADEATRTSRRLWERLGGATALLQSLYWGRVLRPCRFLVSRLEKAVPWGPLAALLRPVCGPADALTVRAPGFHLRRRIPEVEAEELTPFVLRECLEESSRHRAVRPEYDEASLGWLLRLLGRRASAGAFQKVALRDPAGAPIGWYLYHARRGGVGEVLQVGGRPQSLRDVLEHLFYHAWSRGVTALSGRIDASILQDVLDASCVLHHRGYWMLAHARNPELLQAVHSGEAFLTRLEGEWCMRFR
ncbi:MAG: hypothetical protein DMF50_08630 [Acidobacteria bacterium]|nr:MAG: hypothetical protein DMF50_08630 [Acidobacteriota bacterium]